MVDKITTNEVFVQESGTKIRTRCQKDAITDTMIARMVEYHKLDVGDPIVVQCMNHQRDTLLWQRHYVVASRRDFLRRSENIRGDVKHEDAFDVRVIAMGDWQNITPTLEAVDKGPVHKWWVVDSYGDAVVKGLSEEDARAIVSGDKAIPEPEAA